MDVKAFGVTDLHKEGFIHPRSDAKI